MYALTSLSQASQAQTVYGHLLVDAVTVNQSMEGELEAVTMVTMVAILKPAVTMVTTIIVSSGCK